MKPIKVLACDADRATLLLLQDTIREPDFKLTAIMDPSKLFETLRAEPFDRVILGRKMVELQESVILDALKNDPGTCNIPVIVCSSHPEDEAMVREHGADFFSIANPDSRDLLLVVRGRE